MSIKLKHELPMPLQTSTTMNTRIDPLEKVLQDAFHVQMTVTEVSVSLNDSYESTCSNKETQYLVTM